MASRFLKLEKAEESIKLPSCLSHIKKEQHNSSNHEKYSSNSHNATEVLEINILHLLKEKEGIQIEKFSSEYQMKYSEYLNPEYYGFKNLIGLLEAFSHIVDMKIIGNHEPPEILLYAKKLSEDKVISLEKLPASVKLPSKVLNAFNTILSSNNGGLDIDFVPSEYKYYTGEDLDPKCWGFNSILDMLSNLSDIFTICEGTNGAFILCFASKNEIITKNNRIIKNTNEDSLSCSNLNDEDKDARIARKLPLDVQKRLKSLLDDFPNGLEISEIIGAYRGFYGATLNDFNPLEYGYLSLEALLQAHHDLLNVCHYGKNIMVFPIGYLKNVTSSIEFSLPARGAVSSIESYSTYDICKVFMKNTQVDFVIGEVSSPSKFHVIYQGEKYSQALNALMDQMYEFYRAVNKRYEVKKESLLVRTPVVTLYEDLNWYRAIIINIDKEYKIKLFLVDYGTTYSCSYKEVRLLLRNFLKLPAQAISASLYGIRPNKGSNHWTRSSSTTSKFFRYHVQNKYFHSRVHEVSETENLIISLWDENNININKLLVTEGFARYKDGHFPIDFGSSAEKCTTVHSSENNNGSNKIKISTDFEIAKEVSNFDIEKGQENGKSSQCSAILEDSDENIDLFYKKRKVEQVWIPSDQSIHIVYLWGGLYMMSSEISRFIWSSDELCHQLKRDDVAVPSFVMSSSTYADIFKQLLSYGVKDILDANDDFLPNVTIYPLEAVLKILNIFKYKDDATMAIIKNELSKLTPGEIKFTCSKSHTGEINEGTLLDDIHEPCLG